MAGFGPVAGQVLWDGMWVVLALLGTTVGSCPLATGTWVLWLSSLGWDRVLLRTNVLRCRGF